MDYKALICDLDGTVIPNRYDGMPSHAVKLAIAKAQTKLFVSVATARPYFFAEPIIRALELSGPSIFHNGARIIDTSTNQILWERTIRAADVFAAGGIFTKEGLSPIVNDNGRDMLFDQAYTPSKPLSIHVNNIHPALAGKMLKEFETIASITAHTYAGYKSGTVGIVVSHSSATKQYAILELAKILDIAPHEIIGVGDSATDFPLLMACGLKVAMDNAIEDLKSIADYVAPCVEHDGVVDVIERFVLEEKTSQTN